MDRFKEIENGIYEDTKTGLQWSDTIDEMTWEEAVEACESLDLGGHTDWRLPTIEELLDIIDHSEDCIDTDLPDTEYAYYWSDYHNFTKENDYALTLYIDDGHIYHSKKEDHSYVRAVRYAKND